MGHDARVVAYMQEAQCNLLGKTTTAEYGVHTQVLKTTLNPWDSTRHPGTSSTGAAVAVASGMIPWAIGTQTGASITRPASYTGIYAMKPTFGLIPRTGILKTSDTLDTVGFFAQWAEDLHPILETLRVTGKNHPYVHRSLDARQALPLEALKPCHRPWRVGVLMHPPWEQAAREASLEVSEALDAFYQWCEALEQAASHYEVKPVMLPSPVETLHGLHATLYETSLAYYTHVEYEAGSLQGTRFSSRLEAMLERGKQISPQRYQSALHEQDTWIQILDTYWENTKIDVLLTPSTMGIAPLSTTAEYPDAGCIWSLSHTPVITLPLTLHSTAQTTLPMGVSVVAPRYHDDYLLAFLAQLVQDSVAPQRSVTPR
jgi:Asp-tRNA(Asn)/Glu-tRNA(Gln) amidotransferase A subunit family amidase